MVWWVVGLKFSFQPMFQNKDRSMCYPCCGMVYIKEGNVLFNDALNTFYLWLYGVGDIKDPLLLIGKNSS